MTTTLPSESLLIKSFDIMSPNGRMLTGHLYGTEHRSSGRRIIVIEKDGGSVVFDSDSHVDLANARNALDEWLREAA